MRVCCTHVADVHIKADAPSEYLCVYVGTHVADVHVPIKTDPIN